MPGRTLVLRKCGEHESCQLQQVNGGEWQHTPARTTLAQRLARKPEEVQELEAKLAGEVGAAIDLRVRLGERMVYLEDRIRFLEDSLAGLPLIKRLHDEAARIGQELAGSQEDLLARSGRLERDVERLGRLTEKLEQSAKEAKAQSAAAQRDAGAAGETATRLTERVPRIDGLIMRSEDLVQKLGRIDEVLELVRQTGERQATDAASLTASINELTRLIDKERDERIADTAKHQRQLGEVMKHAGPS